ncbi:hypothetical protein TruAng_002796 [Truncatella angustata]|nr:hypothetical protein TruAng_002796 [Truncatella angustata]
MSPHVDQPSTNGNGYGTNGHDAVDPYTIQNTFLGYRRPIKIIVIGFGMSGINLSYILGKQTKNSNITLQFYEKNPELGGTWFENNYAPAQETLAYLKEVVAHHNLDTSVKYNHRLTGAWWEQDQNRWKVKVQPNDDPASEFFDYSDILINATGVLNNWKWPAVPGLEKFKNKVHTAAWDDNIDLNDKVVGVVGNGSSSVQVVPAIYDKRFAKEVKRVVAFMRSPTWVTAGYAPKFAGEGGSNFRYSEEQKKTFAQNPEEYLAYRKAVEREMNSTFAIMIKGTKEQLDAYEFATNEMKRKLKKKPELAEKLIPNTFPVGCRRPNPGHGYLEAISSEKCDVVFSGIAEITEEGIISEDGSTHKVDVLVCGTGFDTSFRPRFPIVGKDGVDLRDAFKDLPDTYLSTMTHNFPNYFSMYTPFSSFFLPSLMLGPFAPYGHGSVIPAIEVITRNIATFLHKFQTQNIKTVMPKKEAMADFRQHRDLFMKKTVWDAPCTSWFKLGPNGDTVMMWPGSRLHCFDVLLNPRWEDYDWEYLMGNRFSYWGNGFTTADAEEEGTDKAWYIAGV